ncbi:MAG: hypothetical protein WBO07_07805 [Formosimonas sp.]
MDASNTTVNKKPVGVLLGIGIFLVPIVFAWFTLQKGRSTLSKVLAFGWLIIGLFVALSGGNTASTSTTTSPAATSKAETEQAMIAALPAITVAQLSQAYNDNTVAADQQFKGKKFKVAGIVSDISTDIMGDPYISMQGGNEFMQPQFSFDKDDSSQLAQIKKGMKLTIVCEGAGDIAKTPISKDCKITQ